MHRRYLLLLAVVAVLGVSLAGCTNKKVNNPLANVGSKQPDKVLFDRAMDQMKHNHMDQARIILQTLINTYPDSEYIARAKLAVGDSWYAEGGSAALAQAENEYKDFETFFPNMPEAAEAQLKIANIHYRQMEKPDRDFTHAMRAEEEYRNLINQYPDSKLVAEAKARLREVQEVLAEREFRIGRFYFLRESWAAAIARLQSVVDDYPLYSGADEALYLLGNAYEHQIDAVRASNLKEAAKGSFIQDFGNKAAVAYSRIITRYPATDRSGDARKRLEALHRPIPTPTPEAIAQSKKEEESRQELSRFRKAMLNMHRGPDTSLASRVGEPTLVDPKPTNAPDIVRATSAALMAAGGNPEGAAAISLETVKTPGGPGANESVPRSDTQPGAAPAENPPDSGIPELRPITPPDNAGNAADTGTAGSSAASTNKSPAPPAQVNEAAGDQGNTTKENSTAAADANGSSSSTSVDKDTTSTSKKKKKKGLGKLNPF
jgi:outer membrane protein assembly factor BamD